MDALPLSIIHRLRGVGIKKGRSGIHHGEIYQYLLPTAAEARATGVEPPPPPPRMITTPIDGVCANCPPSSSFEAMNLTLHTREWRHRAAALQHLREVELRRCPRMTDHGVRIILARVRLTFDTIYFFSFPILIPI